MAVVHPTQVERVRSQAPTVDIAGTAWPVYKLEAVAAGLVTALLLALITGSAQTAVLAAATVAALRWITGALRG
ncbi:hypothetical protein [Nocardia crassostreae]|uniref:hypothetical protein n=1 Tax=Nocardia crassostreae TaxID=53428 RepID=UPI00082FE56A|nr:hypothetical protein [Nocardia crassostreae]